MMVRTSTSAMPRTQSSGIDTEDNQKEEILNKIGKKRGNRWGHQHSSSESGDESSENQNMLIHEKLIRKFSAYDDFLGSAYYKHLRLW